MRVTFRNVCFTAGVIQVAIVPFIAVWIYIGSAFLRDPDSVIEAQDLQGQLWRAGVRFEDKEVGEKVLYELVRSRYEFNGFDAAVWSLLFVANGLVYIKLSRSFATPSRMVYCDAS